MNAAILNCTKINLFVMAYNNHEKITEKEEIFVKTKSHRFILTKGINH